MSVPDTVRHGSREVIFESYPELGYNYRMTDMQAAVGRVQLCRLDALVLDRRRVALAYRAFLLSVTSLGPPDEPQWARSNWQSYCVKMCGDIHQRSLMQGMLDRGVATRRGVMSIHLERSYASEREQSLPRTERAYRNGLILPLLPHMSAADVDTVSRALLAALAGQPLELP